MIAAVVDSRGKEAAHTTLARLGGRWERVEARGGAVVAGAAGASAKAVVSDDVDLDAANLASGVGALVALAPGREGAAVLARGALGGRPLYYASTAEGAWVACSRVEPILAVLGRRPAIDADRVAAHVAGLAHPDVEATSFAGVRRVAPCTAVELTPGRTRVAPRPSVERSPLDAPVAEVAEELWRRFAASVARAIGGARSVAVMVGGGVDSSGLLAAAVAWARGASAREVSALALDFDAECSDRPYLRDLARHLDIVPVRLPPRDAGPWFGESFVLDAQPYILGIGPMEQLVFRRARALGADVLLSGYLADEILAGDMRVIATELTGGAPLAAVARAARLRLPWETTARERVSAYVLRPLLKPFVPRALVRPSAARVHAHDFPWARDRMRRVLARIRDANASLRAPRTPRERFDRFARDKVYADYADWRGQMESVTGMIREDPYADEDVLDLISRVPPSVLVHDDMHRGLFRVALGGRVPESIRTRLTKSWFEPAFAETAEAGGGLESLGALWDIGALADADIADPAGFRRSMEPLFRDPRSTAECSELWSLAIQSLACESFCRRYA
jgi:asparagine synthetase B (glutamine-hydrolysing)